MNWGLLMVEHSKSLFLILLFFPFAVAFGSLICKLFILTLGLLRVLKSALIFGLDILCILVVKDALAILTEEEIDLSSALKSIFQTEIKFKEATLLTADRNRLIILSKGMLQHWNEIISKLWAESGQFNHKLTKSKWVLGNVGSQWLLVLLKVTKTALEPDHLILEDLLWRQAKQVRTVELQLRWAVQTSIDQLLSVSQHFLGEFVLLLDHNQVLGVAQVESDGHC